jgi:hypothetical protein
MHVVRAALIEPLDVRVRLSRDVALVVVFVDD